MRKNSLSYLAVAVAAFAVACADATSPSARNLAVEGPQLVVHTPDVVGVNKPAGTLWGEVWLCKRVASGDPSTNSFSFTVSSVAEIGSPVVAPLVPAPQFTNITAGATPSPSTSGCQLIHDMIREFSDVDRIVITETAQANWSVTDIDVRQYLFDNTTLPGNSLVATIDPANRTATVRNQSEKVTIVTFINDHSAPPTTGCTYTKGWYQNKNGAPTVIGVDGRSQTQAQAIFAATPGKPNGVTWGSDNLLLNLYQQLLAALNNLGGDANATDGPDDVDTAIAAALAGTGGSGLAITTTLSHDEMSDLVDVLSAFNEGTYAGWPHCGESGI